MFIYLLAALLALGCATHSPTQQGKKSPKDLAEAFVAGLNGGEAGLKVFIAKWCSADVPVEQRLMRMKRVADQGAPFRFVKMIRESKEEALAVFADRSGEELGVKFELTPEMTMASVLMGPLDALNAPPPKDYRNFKDLASLCESVIADTKTPAIGLSIWHGDKVESASAGVRSLGGSDKVGPDEPWSIGSIGKPICSTVIGRLIETGKLRWDMTLEEALPGMAMKDGYRKVTLEQIMQHRGGIPQDLGMNQARVDGIVAGATDWAKIRENYIKDVLGRDPIAKPGERNAYSNAGYALLGFVAERAMGKPYEAVVHELVFDPLGLKHSYMGTDKLPEARPHGHMPGPKGLRTMDFGGPMEIMFAPAGGGMWMSTSDLVRFGQAHLDGLKGKDGLLKAETVRRLHKGIPEGPDGQFLYGCGWGIETLRDGLVFHGHNGSNGTMRAQLCIFPELNLVVGCIVNAGGESEPAPPLQAAVAVARKLRG